MELGILIPGIPFPEKSQKECCLSTAISFVQRQIVVTHIFYFMLCLSSLLSTVISLVYKDKWWFDESMSVIFCVENT